MNNLTALRMTYEQLRPTLDKFELVFRKKLTALFDKQGLSPILKPEGRIKDWTSIVDKIDRRGLELGHPTELWDLIGLRFVFLYQDDYAKACDLLKRECKIDRAEDVGERLGEKEFGYKSFHYVARPPDEWLVTPRLRKLSGYRAEVQIRTLSQHSWAVASRLLGYNQEQDVPRPVQRSLSRMAALMELVDLELTRVQEDKAVYLDSIRSRRPEDRLNGDLVRAIVTENVPKEHAIRNDGYTELLTDLTKCGLTTVQSLEFLIRDNLTAALNNDAEAQNAVMSGDQTLIGDPILLNRGVFYSSVGLVQNMLNLNYGENWRK